MKLPSLEAIFFMVAIGTLWGTMCYYLAWSNMTCFIGGFCIGILFTGMDMFQRNN